MGKIKPVVQKIGFNIYLDTTEYSIIQNMLYDALEEAKEEYVEALKNNSNTEDEDAGYYEEKRVNEIGKLIKMFEAGWSDN